jgi:hypothetical protein
MIVYKECVKYSLNLNSFNIIYHYNVSINLVSLNNSILLLETKQIEQKLAIQTLKIRKSISD